MNTWACKTSCQKGMNTFVPVATIDALRERIRCFEGGARHERTALPFGVDAIDERLPEGGLALGALHEVAGGGDGAIDGAAAALFAAGIAARTRGRVLWCVTRQDLFAPALAQAGLALDRVIYVEAGDDKAVLACFEEALRHRKLGAVVAEVAHTASRRLQHRSKADLAPMIIVRSRAASSLLGFLPCVDRDSLSTVSRSRPTTRDGAGDYSEARFSWEAFERKRAAAAPLGT
jgi:protein ImuA